MRWATVLLLFFVIPFFGWADTIHFKNGTFIEVDRATEKDNQVEYVLG